MAITPLTDSRIANASGTWQGGCDVDITGWNKSNEFILSSFFEDDRTHGPGAGRYFKMRWRRAGGTWYDVSATSEICWGTSTSLVDGDSVANPSGCQTSDLSQENEGDNSAYLSPAAGEIGEIQWALGFGSGAQDSQEYEFEMWNDTDNVYTTLSVSITTQAGAGGYTNGVNGVDDSNISAVNGVSKTNISEINGS